MITIAREQPDDHWEVENLYDLCFAPGREALSSYRLREGVAPVLDTLENVELTLLIGSYAQAYHLGKKLQKNMTETVRAWRDYLPEILPTPHPSWRTNGWQKKNRWFDDELLPELRRRVHGLIG